MERQYSTCAAARHARFLVSIGRALRGEQVGAPHVDQATLATAQFGWLQ
ncbi:hypothetical protein [Xanthomonas sp. WHRI 8932A]|nr:hypothetical protein [Xanthomonas sp. WHRI 8932A]MEA9565924.1 hypothetical protein [Xanthomonas sp. WHRI 8932A]